MKKTFKFLGIAAMTLCLGLSFAACEEDPEENAGTPNQPEVPAEPILLNESFDNGIPSNWTVLDKDDDGYSWALTTEIIGEAGGFNGTEGVASQSFSNQEGPLTPDNYLISPEITITHNGYTLSYYVGASDADWYKENYSVLVGTLDGETFTPIGTLTTEVVATADLTQKTFNLDAYKGKTVRIAFRHHDITDQFNMIIDEVKVAQAE
jgi:hypothetical protein